MHTLHGALDNNSPVKRLTDIRYQPANEPIDDRWNGANPEAHGYDKVFLQAWVSGTKISSMNGSRSMNLAV